MKIKHTLDKIIDHYKTKHGLKFLDDASEKCGFLCLRKFEEEIDLWETYGGD
jgi:hypothetical protein